MTVLLWLAGYAVGLTGYVLAHRAMGRLNAAAEKAARDWVEARTRANDLAAFWERKYTLGYPAVYVDEIAFYPLIPYVAPNGERVLSDAEQAALVAEIGL